MHNSHILDTVQLSAAAERGVQVWRHPVLGHLFLLVARGCAANDAVAAGNRAPQPPGPSWSVESRAYITRLVVNPISLSVVMCVLCSYFRFGCSWLRCQRCCCSWQSGTSATRTQIDYGEPYLYY